MSPCQVSIYYRSRPPHSISIMGKGKCVAPIDRLTLFDICFISCSDCHSLRAFSTARYSQHFRQHFLMGLCGLAALRRHLALPPYESSIRVLKVREFVNSFFPSIFSTDRLFYSTNHRRGPSIMRSRDLFWPISDLSVAVTSFYYSRLEAIGR